MTIKAIYHVDKQIYPKLQYNLVIAFCNHRFTQHVHGELNSTTFNPIPWTLKLIVHNFQVACLTLNFLTVIKFQPSSTSNIIKNLNAMNFP